MSSDSHQLRRFTLRLFAFLLPLAVVLGLPAATLLQAGELIGIDEIIRRQSTADSSVLFGRAYSDPTPRYKLLSVLRRNPEVLVLGTSRVLSIRSEFFRNGTRFFNAGNGITRLAHLRQFLDRLPPERTPKVILLGIDQYFLNGNFDPLADDDMKLLWASEPSWATIFISSWKNLYRDYLDSKFTIATLMHPTVDERYGLSAIVYANAFRNDGSYHWGRYVSDPHNPNNPDYQFRNTLDRIAEGNRRFEYASHVAEKNLAELDAFLDDCHARGIHVIAFLPPFAHVVYERMRSMPERYGYLAELTLRLEPLFERHRYALYDFSDLATLGASDAETIDGFHGSEKAYLRLFLQMSQTEPVLRRYARDPLELKERLQATVGDHQVFGPGTEFSPFYESGDNTSASEGG